ncbi:MAG: TPM domain-containing protein [Hydrococcus sp. C42_A2020_068]|uniref:photosystem II repair protein Psb32 n=1 Tax=Pleurocapsa sp. PCC 7327 TaxID=118163 RepID=UPI00029FE0FC|nr:TPM domain-containing protein [Pleurocapsa sp. PCC 7327]AFY77619.1 beta-propeller domain-containing protein, methanol dehydrogenase [Pleurocapsa sp. PCC 7327]MBF2019143.1 TPM domain-containing protein [Hydrococcus sp. C42_A2020_068]
MKQSLTPHNSKQRILARLFAGLLSFIFALGLMAAPAKATGAYDLPSLGVGSSTWVVDSAEVISLANEGKLSSALKQLAQKTGNEVRMVVIRRLDFDETIDSFADKLFANWYPTPEERANETLLVMDTLTNSTAIRTGEAVKAIMSDEIAKSVASETVAIPLREGNKYNQALLEASDRLVAVLSGQPDPGPPSQQELNIESTFASAEETDDRSATVWVVVLLVLATAIPMATYFWYVGLPGR